MDFNDAKPQKIFDVIPSGTVATLHLTVRPGQAGEGGWLTRSKDGNSEALDCEFVVVDGQYAKRKFWARLLVDGTTNGHAQAGEITRARIRAILEIGRSIKPDDTSEAARQARQIAGWADLDGLRFIGRIGVEPARDGYAAKNVLLDAVTPERRDWPAVEQVTKRDDAAAGAAAKPAGAKPEAAKQVVRPQWAS